MAQELIAKERKKSLWFLILVGFCVSLTAVPACGNTSQIGDVFVAVSNGKVQHRDAAGQLIETLDTLQPSFTTGMAFDSFGNLYVTNFGAGTVSRFDNAGGLIGTFGSGYSGSPESIVFDRNGNVYVGAVNGDDHIRKFDPLGNPLGQFVVATEDRGSDWIDLAPDQCTMFYTSEGPHVKRFDVCANIQLSDFNAISLPNFVSFALRILPDGSVLVANTSQIVRLDLAGNLIQTYNSAGEGCWFALNLDPDGKSFWSADFCSSRVHKFDIQTGAELLSFNTGTGSFTVFGLVIFGELSASRPLNLAATFGPSGSSTNRSGVFSDPVNTATGNYYFSRADLIIPGRGQAFNFTRSYNSLDSYGGPLGTGWTHSYNIFLRKNASGDVTVKEADGHEVLFVPAGGGSYSPATLGVFDSLTGNADGSFILTRKNQTTLSFSQNGKLLSITDRNGNLQRLSYDGAGNLDQITDTVGRNVFLSYDTNGRIVQITDPLGRSVVFSYDGTNNLVQAVDPAGGITTFTYDLDHRVVAIVLPDNQTLLQNTYDAIGRIISQTNGRGFASVFAYGTPNPTDTTITDARGNRTVHTSDASSRIVKITDATAATVFFTYDSNNNRTSVTNQNGKATIFGYDGRGNVTSITDPIGNAAVFVYDSQNNLLNATNPKGKTTAFSYDANSNLTRIQDAAENVTAFVYDGFGQLSSKMDARGDTTVFSYDSSGNLTQISDALSHSTSLTYDGIGRLTSITDPNNHTVTAVYDALSRLVKISDPLGDQTLFAYDAIGNLLKIMDANGHATNYGYDAVNNLVTVTDALGHVTRYAYDANNNRTTFTNAKGNATSYTYDALNRLIRITDPLSFITSYAYDPVGNAVAITDAKGQTNRFSYDALNRLLTIAYADGNTLTYTYDANGKRISMVDSHGATTYTYDVLDRLISVNNPGANIVSYNYDPVGNRKRLTFPDGKAMNYSYDAVNRLAQVSDWLGRTTTYSYDPASNLLRIAYPNTAALVFGYDATNRLLKVSNSYRGSTDLPFNPVTSFTYKLDAVGNRLQVTDGSGKTTLYGYDPLNELISVTAGTSVTRFTYDFVGNRLSLTAPGTIIKYSYDKADRLLQAGTGTFTYDANGNQTSVTRTISSIPIFYQYDAANRLIVASGGVINSTFFYDGDGNRVGQSTSKGAYSYFNDVTIPLPVVLQEAGPDGNIFYAYGLGRISESGPNFDFFYHYDGLGSVAGLTNPDGKLAGRYVYDSWGQTDLSVPDTQIGTKNKFRFTGEALDPETQLYFLRARYYDPSIGRLSQPDPYRGSVHSPKSMRRYPYANNNPLRFSDPSGLLVYGVSLGAEADIGLGLTGELALVYDDKGNRAIALTGGFSGGLGGSVGGSVFVTKDATIDDFAGQAFSLDGSIGPLNLSVLLDSSGNFEGGVVGVVKGGLDVGASVTWTDLVGRNAWWVPNSPVNWTWVQQTLAEAEALFYGKSSSASK